MRRTGEKNERRISWAAAVAVVMALTLAGAGCAETEDGSAAAAERGHQGQRARPDKAGGSHKPAAVHRTVKRQEKIPFTVQVRNTDDLRKGVTQVSQTGSDGVRLKVYRITVEGGAVTARALVRSVVVRKPVPRITLRGTRVDPAPTCDPNYSGQCVPIASDVDCGGGSGNGPAYVYGPVRVVGVDIYGLDADGDGWGCD